MRSRRAPTLKSDTPAEPGQQLKRARERLGLRYRDVEAASLRIAQRRGNDEFAVGLSRLADIENRGTVPSLFRLYSLCTIYRLGFNDALSWYGVDLTQMPADATTIAISHTHVMDFRSVELAPVEDPLQIDTKLDPRQTHFLNRHIQKWGKLPVAALNGLDFRRQRYGYLGTDDWSMYPILAPGSFVQIDESKRKLQSADSWSTEYERPIYFLEHRHGFKCCWCIDRQGLIISQSHPSSNTPPEIFQSTEVDVVGQVVGVAMRLDLGKRRHTYS